MRRAMKALDEERNGTWLKEYSGWWTGNRPHGVFDPPPFDANVETVAHFATDIARDVGKVALL